MAVRERGRSLRVRLTALLAVVLLVATAVAGTVTALSLRTFLTGRLDDQLAAAQGRFADSRGDDDTDDVVPGQAVGTLGVLLRGGQVDRSALVGPGGRVEAASLTPVDLRELAALPVGGSPHTVDLDRLHDYRLQAVAGPTGEVLVTGLPEAEVDATMRRLIAVESVLFVVVIAAAGAVVAVLVRRTLRPLDDLATTARDVAALPLATAATPLPTPPPAADAPSEVGQVADAFGAMLDHIRDALAGRDATEERLRRFVADASHEFRTPLATIRAHSELVQQAPVPPTPEVAAAFTRIDAATERMSAMVEDLLLLARLDDDGVVAGDAADLTRVVVEAVVEARTLAPQHRWHLHLPGHPVTVAVAEDRVQRVVVNLVSNARVHTPPGTAVDVTVEPADTRGVVRLSVVDDGPGIAPAVRAVSPRVKRSTPPAPPSPVVPGSVWPWSGRWRGRTVARSTSRAGRVARPSPSRSRPPRPNLSESSEPGRRPSGGGVGGQVEGVVHACRHATHPEEPDVTSTRTDRPAAPRTGRSGARTAYTAVIGVAALVVLLQAVWAGLFIHEGQDYSESWVEIHARGADLAILLGVVAVVILLVKLRDRRDLLVGTAVFTVALVLEAYVGGLIGDTSSLTVVHLPLAMAIMGLSVWLPFRAVRH